MSWSPLEMQYNIGWWVCSVCGKAGPSNMAKEHETTCGHAARLQGALIALARVAVFVAMEAMAQERALAICGIDFRRRVYLADAVEDGRLRITWPEGMEP